MTTAAWRLRAAAVGLHPGAGLHRIRPSTRFSSSVRKIGLFAFDIFFGVAQKNVIALRVSFVLDAARDFGEKGVGIVNHDQANGAGPVGNEAARDVAGAITQPVNNGLDALAGGVADTVFTVNGARNRHQGDPGFAGHIVHRRALFSHRSPHER